MAYDFPDDLVDLRRRFDAADARCRELSEALPPAVELLETDIDSSSEEFRPLNEARAQRLRLLEEIEGHAFWGGVDDAAEARNELRKAARETI